MQKRNYKIVVTDSGLGGLSVAADLHKKLKQGSPYPDVEIIYYNALADYTLGYNDMKTAEQKASVFNNALCSMHELYQPDVILIACNTLSVVYRGTEFAEKEKTKVTGIVDTSIRLMSDFLNQNKDAVIVIFGTKTTIGSNLYPTLLMKKGFPANRIVSEAGSTIHLEIEKDPKSESTERLINEHVQNVLDRIGKGSRPIGASLNCTHYGYAEPFFKRAFTRRGANLKALINPNTFMTDSIFENNQLCEDPNISVKVVSQVTIDQETISAMSNLLALISPEVAQALRNYQHDPDLFEWEFVKE